MKNIIFLFSICFFTINASAQNVTIIKSQDRYTINDENRYSIDTNFINSFDSDYMDIIWDYVAKGMGFTSTVVSVNALNSISNLSSTDILVISSAYGASSAQELQTIVDFVLDGHSVYIQSEYLKTDQGSETFDSIMQALGVDFNWTTSERGALTPMNVEGRLSTTPNNANSLNYFWGGLTGNGGPEIEKFLGYNENYFGFIYSDPTSSNGSVITVSDRNWIKNEPKSLDLMENILFALCANTDESEKQRSCYNDTPQASLRTDYEFWEVGLGGELKGAPALDRKDFLLSYGYGYFAFGGGRKTWGYSVESNYELEQLYKMHPDCKAIRLETYQSPHDDLYGMDSSDFTLTEVIGKFSNLKYLEINSDRIKKYPSSIENLKNLEHLEISVSGESFEIDFSNFTNLKHLTIKDNYTDDLKLKKFPVSIFNLKNLVSLNLLNLMDVSDKELKGIDTLNRLNELNIWNSDLRLPEDFKGNSNLTSLILHEHMKSVPEGVFEISSLVHLGLSSVGTLDLQQISKLKNLKSLDLSDQEYFQNKINLPILEHLTITSYKGRTLDIGISELKSLENLIIWSCPKIEKLDNFSSGALTSIAIVSNEELKKLVFDETRLSNIEQVIVSRNKKLKLKKTTIGNENIEIWEDY